MLRPVALALTVLTGFTGLAYEVTWQKYLAILLGAHSEATASVLGLFLGGLSLGYWIFGALTRRLVLRGRRSGRPAPLLAVYGAVEAGIGFYCVLFPSLFPWVRSASAWLPTGSGALGFAVDVLLAAVLIVPPATLMGGTIPILTQALARSLSDATRLHALVYACNTAGAFAGALATGFVLIHWLGLSGVLHALGVVNLVAGSVFALLGWRRREIVELKSDEVPPLRAGIFTVYGSVALLVGFAMMVLQTIVIRIGGLAFGSSEYTFSMVVAVFVLCIALGSFAVSALPRIGRHVLTATLWCLGLLFTGLYFALKTATYWAHVLRVLFQNRDEAFYPFYTAAFECMLLVLGPAVVLSGATLPLLFHTLRHEVGDLGSQAGRLYSVNTIGSLLGALLGGYALLFWLDLHQVYRIAVATLFLAAAIVTLHQIPRIRFAGAAAIVLISLFAIGQLPSWRTSYLTAGTFRLREPVNFSFDGPSALFSQIEGGYLFYRDDPNSSVSVREHEVGKELTRSLIVNGKPDGNTFGDYSTMALLALVPALFAERVEHAFVIGLGLGVSPAELAELEETQSVTVAEISSGVIEAAPLFDSVNHGVSVHPKVQLVHNDAYRALLKGRHSYDVIVSEPSNPWVTGVEMLYSREFLAEARDRLTPRGVYCQWYHLYETSPEALELVLETYASVFAHVAVWSVDQGDLLLLGFRDGESALDLARIERRMQQPDFRAGFARLHIEDLPTLLVHETLPLGVVHAAALAGPVHSLYHPRLGFAAGRGFFVGSTGSLPFTGYGEAAATGATNSLLKRYLEGFDGAIPERVWEEIASRACAEGVPGCEALVAAWSLAQPESATLQSFLSRMRQSGRVRQLTALLQPPVPSAADRLRSEQVLELTWLFMERYAHAAPFDPGALLGFWKRCGSNENDVARCEPGLRAAERLVQGEAPPDLEDWVVSQDVIPES